MDRLIYTAMTGANAAAHRQSVLSNNLANVSTTGFKAELSAYRAVPLRGDGATTRVFALEATSGHLSTPGSAQHTGRDLDAMAVTLLAPEERRGEITRITGMERREGRALLSGIESDRSWSVMILDDGSMTLTIAAEESGFVVFGRCLPADQTRP